MALREHGVEPMALNALLARLGTPDPVEATLSLDHLAKSFDVARLGRSDIRFDLTELDKANAGTLHMLEYDEVKERLLALDCDLGPDFWAAVRPNLTRFAEAADWARIAEGPVAPAIEDPIFASRAADLLPDGPWDETTWKAWTDIVKAETGAKGKALFMPLRQALTGLDHGPELKNLLPLIGRERAEARLRGKKA
jgi:glutamyl-tRNA synthetase